MFASKGSFASFFLIIMSFILFIFLSHHIGLVPFNNKLKIAHGDIFFLFPFLGNSILWFINYNIICKFFIDALIFLVLRVFTINIKVCQMFLLSISLWLLSSFILIILTFYSYRYPHQIICIISIYCWIPLIFVVVLFSFFKCLYTVWGSKIKCLIKIAGKSYLLLYLLKEFHGIGIVFSYKFHKIPQ